MLERLLNFGNAMPGVVSLGLIWGIMAIGLYITYRILNLSDLTVDGSFCTGGAVPAGAADHLRHRLGGILLTELFDGRCDPKDPKELPGSDV